MLREGELLRRWEVLRAKWTYWIPTITVDEFIRTTLNDAKEDYPKWENCVEDITQGENAVEAIIQHLKRIWAWVFRWWL